MFAVVAWFTLFVNVVCFWFAFVCVLLGCLFGGFGGCLPCLLACLVCLVGWLVCCLLYLRGFNMFVLWFLLVAWDLVVYACLGRLLLLCCYVCTCWFRCWCIMLDFVAMALLLVVLLFVGLFDFGVCWFTLVAVCCSCFVLVFVWVWT